VSDPIKTTVTIRISRVSGGNEAIPFNIRIIDDDARVVIVDANFSINDFADLLTNREIEATAKIRTEFIGMARETKTELVPFKFGFAPTKAAKKKALAPFEVDGWIGYEDDLTNHHNSDRNGNMRVGFYRHVPKAVPNA